MKNKPTYKELERKIEILKSDTTSVPFLDLLGDLYIELDNKGIVTQVNTRTCEVIGCQENELLGKNWFEFFLPKSIKNKIFTKFKERVLSKTYFFELYENPILTKKGTERIISWRNIFVKDSNGEITGSVSFGEDITERKEVTQKLKDQNSELIVAKERLEEVQEMAKLGHWELDIVKNELIWSDEIYRIFELQPQEFEANYESFLENIHPEDREKVNDAYLNSLQDKTPYKIEHRLLSKSGKIKHVLERCKTDYNKKGEAIRSIGTILDITKQIELEEILRKSEEKFKQLSNLTFEGILIHNKGVAIDYNLSFLKMFGYLREELRGKNIIDFIIPKKYHETIAKTIVKKQILPFEIEGIKKDGSVFPIEIEARDFVSESNKLFRVAAIRDISEKVIARKALFKSEEKFRAIVENTSEWIWEMDETGVIIYSNSVVESILGHSNIELMGKNNFNLIHKLDRERIQKVFTQKVEQQKGWKNLELRWSHKDGSYRYLESSAVPILNEDGILTGFRGVNRDITERKLADAEYKKLSTVVAQSANTIIITDTDGKIEYTNPRFTEVSGYTAEEVVGKNPKFLGSGRQNEEFHAKVWETVKSGKIWKGEFQNKAKNGDLFWEQATISPIRNDEGEIRNFLTIKEDITILKNALLKAKESDKLKSSFLASMSHEIRTPMNSIIGFSEFLLEPNLSKNKRIDFAEIVISNSKQLLTIVNDLLDISKIEAGAVHLNYESVNINKMLDDLCTFYIPLAKENNLNLHCEKGLENYKSVIDIDKTKLNQVLTNLLSNAFKFTKKGEVEFGYELVKDNLQFYVKDTGKGITEKLKDKIFDRFFQGNLDLNKQYAGTGLGLAISKNFVELFNGNIWFTSSKKGTTVYFTVPYIKREKNVATTVFEDVKMKAKEPKEKSITILVAEDEEYNMMYINVLFSKTNYKIIEANNGKEALSLFKKNPKINVVLMDIQMPVMNGNEAMKEIKKINPSVPIIALSAFAMESDKEEALKKGFDFYISKPIDKKLLFETIEKYTS